MKELMLQKVIFLKDICINNTHCFDNDGDVNIISEHLTHHILVENMTCFTFFPFSNNFMGFDFDGVNHKSLPKLP